MIDLTAFGIADTTTRIHMLKQCLVFAGRTSGNHKLVGSNARIDSIRSVGCGTTARTPTTLIEEADLTTIGSRLYQSNVVDLKSGLVKSLVEFAEFLIG